MSYIWEVSNKFDLNQPTRVSHSNCDINVFYQVLCALFYKGNYDEILPVHNTWKVPEKGFKIN